MMSNPEVSYSRPQHPDKIPRPPPKSFADFQSATDAVKTPDSVAKASFVPKSEPSAPGLEATQTEMRIGLLEQRVEALEGELEELTEAATRPQQASSAPLIARFVRMAVIEGLMSAEVALYAIACELGLVDVSSKPRTVAAGFLPRPAAPSQAFSIAPVAPPPPAKRAAVKAPEPEPEPEEDEEETADVASKSPRKRHAGRPSDAMRKAQEGPRKAVLALMAAHGISQGKISKASGLPQTAVSRWMRGAVSFDPTFVTKVERAVKKLV